MMFDIGVYIGGRSGIDRIVDSLKDDFPEGSYNVVLRNCNHFSEAFCAILLPEIAFPGNINRVAKIGSLVPCLFGSSLEAPVGDSSTSFKTRESGSPQSFTGTGHVLSKTSPRPRRRTDREDDVDKRRTEIREARLRKLVSKN